jgi:hypothetical protein
VWHLKNKVFIGSLIAAFTAAIACKNREYQSASLLAKPGAEGIINLSRLMVNSSNPALNPYVKEHESFDNDKLSGERFCIRCHPEQVAQWQDSNHSLAAKDPVFNWLELKVNLLNRGNLRTPVKRNPMDYRDDDPKMPNLCVRCHSPAAAHDNIITNPNRTVIAQIIDSGHKVAQEAVTCTVCHSAVGKFLDDVKTLDQIEFNVGTNIMTLMPIPYHVRSGNHRAENGVEARKRPPASNHMAIMAHTIDYVNFETSPPALPSTRLDSLDHNPIGYIPQKGSNPFDPGVQVNALDGICIQCHNVQVRPHSGLDSDPLEQETYFDWEFSQTFSGNINCIDCHMSNLPNLKLASELSKTLDELEHASQKNNLGGTEQTRSLRNDAFSKVRKVSKKLFPTGNFSILEFPDYKNVRKTSHAFVGGYNIPSQTVYRNKYDDIANKKLEMYQNTLSFEPITQLEKSSKNSTVCQPPKLGVRLKNTLSGHAIPTGFSQFRELWVETVLKCDGNIVFKSGKLDDCQSNGIGCSSQNLPDITIGWEKYSDSCSTESDQSKATSCREYYANQDFFHPIITGPGPEAQTLISFNNYFMDRSPSEGGRRILDFATANYYSRFSRDDAGKSLQDRSDSHGPILPTNKGGVKEIYYPPIDFSQCKSGHVEGYSQLKLRFFSPWLLQDIIKNIAAGRNFPGKLGYPKEALADIDSKKVEEITEKTLEINRVYPVFAPSEINFRLDAKNCEAKSQ